MKSRDVYVSVDVETDGRIPGRSSMLSLGAVALDIDKNRLGVFSCNFDLADGAEPEPETAEFWKDNPQAYAATRTATVSPECGSRDFCGWVADMGRIGRPVFVAFPAVFDWKWVDHYCLRHTGCNPFGHGEAIDIKSYGWELVGGEFTSVSKSSFPPSMFDPVPHTHVAVDDALEQGLFFINLLRSRRGLERI